MLRKIVWLLCVFIFSCPALVATAASITAGNPKGSVTLIEYFDYQCPHCRNMSATIDELIKNSPDLRVVYRVVPFVSNMSWFEASAALAAKDQGKFKTFHDLLMQQRQSPSEQDILLLAKQAGLDTNKLYADMHQAHISNQLNANLKSARELNVNGVPTFFIEKTGNSQSPTRYDGEITLSKMQEAIAKLQ